MISVNPNPIKRLRRAAWFFRIGLVLIALVFVNNILVEYANGQWHAFADTFDPRTRTAPLPPPSAAICGTIPYFALEFGGLIRFPAVIGVVMVGLSGLLSSFTRKRWLLALVALLALPIAFTIASSTLFRTLEGHGPVPSWSVGLLNALVPIANADAFGSICGSFSMILFAIWLILLPRKHWMKVAVVLPSLALTGMIVVPIDLYDLGANVFGIYGRDGRILVNILAILSLLLVAGVAPLGAFHSPYKKGDYSKCGDSLEGLSTDTCPECGTATSAERST